MMAHRVYLEYANLATDPCDIDTARDSLIRYISTICADTNPSIRWDYVKSALGYFDDGINDKVPFKTVFIQSVVYATEMLICMHFGVFDITKVEMSEYRLTIRDMLKYMTDCGGRL